MTKLRDNLNMRDFFIISLDLKTELLTKDIEEIIEVMAFIFRKINPNGLQYHLDMGETLLINSLFVVKKLRGKDATFSELNKLIQNQNNAGEDIISEFLSVKTKNEIENLKIKETSAYFKNDYFKENSKAFKDSHLFRSMVTDILSTK